MQNMMWEILRNQTLILVSKKNDLRKYLSLECKPHKIKTTARNNDLEGRWGYDRRAR